MVTIVDDSVYLEGKILKDGTRGFVYKFEAGEPRTNTTIRSVPPRRFCYHVFQQFTWKCHRINHSSVGFRVDLSCPLL